MVAREGAAPPISGCRPDVILFHHRAKRSWLPGLDSHQHGRLQRAVSYSLDDPATKWWAREDLHLQGSQILDLWGLLFPLNHSPKTGAPVRPAHSASGIKILIQSHVRCW